MSIRGGYPVEMRLFALLLMVAGCATPTLDARPPEPSLVPRPPETAETAAAPAPFAPRPGDPAFATVRSQRFQLSIPLPDRAGWALDKDGSSFLVMRHAATRSTLLARRWREQAPMNRERCEQAARLIRDLPAREGTVDQRYLGVPPGFDTRVDLGAHATVGGGVAGWLLAFGASGRRCFAFVYTTEAEGAAAEQAVGDRLAVMQTLVLERLELHRDTELELRPPARD